MIFKSKSTQKSIIYAINKRYFLLSTFKMPTTFEIFTSINKFYIKLKIKNQIFIKFPEIDQIFE
jgi:hypothetical protein